MKKKLFFCTLLLAVCALGAKTGLSSTYFEDNNGLALENLEALSDGESTSDCKLYLTRICTSGNKDHHFYRRVE